MDIICDPNSLQSIQLLEIPDPVMLRASKLELKGSGDDPVVLCTDSATFQLKELQTSNTILITESVHKTPLDLIDTLSVVGQLSQTWEISKSVPRLDKLQKYLNTAVYSGENSEIFGPSHFWDWEDLISNVQASEKEIRSALERFDALAVHGRYRLLETTYTLELIQTVSLTLRSHGISIICFDGNDLISRISCEQNIPAFIMEHMIDKFSIPISGKPGFLRCLDKQKCCSLLAGVILKKYQRMTQGNFMQRWQQLTDEIFGDGVFLVDTELLHGLAWFDKTQSVVFINYFPKDRLSFDPSKRLQAIFSAKPRWSLPELKPYLRDLVETEKELGALLLKFCRSILGGSGDEGSKIYTSRLPIEVDSKK